MLATTMTPRMAARAMRRESTRESRLEELDESRLEELEEGTREEEPPSGTGSPRLVLPRGRAVVTRGITATALGACTGGEQVMSHCLSLEGAAFICICYCLLVCFDAASFQNKEVNHMKGASRDWWQGTRVYLGWEG